MGGADSAGVVVSVGIVSDSVDCTETNCDDGGVGDEADLKRPETELDLRLDLSLAVPVPPPPPVLLLAECVLKRLMITMGLAGTTPTNCQVETIGERESEDKV